jgi:tRNA threonylcarbamoyladenosine biosynthesis protein TsaE
MLDMSIGLNCQINSTSSKNTEKIAYQIGKNLHGGEVIELISDLGGGKTVFAKGLAQGAGSQDTVSSPTFTISKLYHSPHFDIHHFDFYRLSDPGIVSLELQEAIDDPKAVVIIEWADIVTGVLPAKRLTVKLTCTDENQRNIEIIGQQEMSYLLKGVDHDAGHHHSDR